MSLTIYDMPYHQWRAYCSMTDEAADRAIAKRAKARGALYHPPLRFYGAVPEPVSDVDTYPMRIWED